jgi:type II secretory ATPase GspE/PulE/Tfp pilus assembly ATPase PilB-like protein
VKRVNRPFRHVRDLFGTHKSQEWVEWTESRQEVTINNNIYFCRFFLSETPTTKLLSVRLNQQKEKIFSPDSWGMDPAQTRVFNEFLGKRSGLLLFCGSDLHGIDENLHATAKMLATPAHHVMAVEAFQETWMPEVEQFVSNENPEVFTQLLKLAQQHNPDVLVVNPLSRKSDFDICLRGSMKGQFILGRSYAYDTAEVLIQLLGMGVEPYILGSALLGVVSKRTLRLNCPRCQIEDVLARSHAKEMGIPDPILPPTFYQGKGCDYCHKTGFDGETDIFEVFAMSEEARLILTPDVKAETIRQLIKSIGMLTLRQVALHKAINGQISLSEVVRVTPK